jgi:hypothetical protein
MSKDTVLKENQEILPPGIKLAFALAGRDIDSDYEKARYQEWLDRQEDE